MNTLIKLQTVNDPIIPFEDHNIRRIYDQEVPRDKLFPGRNVIANEN